jgi:hypothetical protein
MVMFNFEDIRKEIEHSRKGFSNLETVLDTFDQMVDSYIQKYDVRELSMLGHAYWHSDLIRPMPLLNCSRLNRFNEVLIAMSKVDNIHVPINFISDVGKCLDKDYFKFDEVCNVVEKYSKTKNVSNLQIMTSSIGAYIKNYSGKRELSTLLEFFDFCHCKEFDENALIILNLWSNQDMDNVKYKLAFRELKKFKSKGDDFFRVLQTFDNIINVFDFREKQVVKLSEMLSSYSDLSDLDPNAFRNYYLYQYNSANYVCEDYFTSPLPLSCISILSEYISLIKISYSSSTFENEFNLYFIDSIERFNMLNVSALLSKTDNLKEKEKIFLEYFQEVNTFIFEKSPFDVAFEYLINRKISNKDYSNSLNCKQKEKLMEAYEISLNAYATICFNDPYAETINPDIIKEKIETIFFDVYNHELAQLNSLQEKQELMFGWANNVIRTITKEPGRLLEYFNFSEMINVR